MTSTSETTSTTTNETPINVIDSIMGSGKTTWMMNHINETNAKDPFLEQPLNPRFLYVAPLLTEVDRVRRECPHLNFKDPKPVHGRKFYHLKQLIEAGENVCTTHSLFTNLDRETYDLIKAQNYTLVIDEVIACVDMFKSLSPPDRRMLFDGGYVHIEQGGTRLRWNHLRHPAYQGKFDDIRSLCDNGNLVVYRPASAKGDRVVLIWEFPSDFLRCFKEVFILTYLFDGSPMRSYFDAEGLRFTMKAVQGNSLMSWGEVDEAEIKDGLRRLVSVYEGPMNTIGTKNGKSNPLSSSWFKRATESELRRLKMSTTKFFERISRTPSRQNGWTTFKGSKKSLRGKGYSRGFIPVNAKATNEYGHKRAMAYLVNVFQQPIIKGFFEDRGIPVNEDIHALSEMVQWVWRSGVRNGEAIHVFIPSERMRKLFKEWLLTDNTAAMINRYRSADHVQVRLAA